MAHDVTVPESRSHDREEGAEVLNIDPPRWDQRWQSMPARRRKALSVGTVLALAMALTVVGVVQVRAWQADRDRREFVSLGVSIGVWASSSSPPGGEVRYYLAIHNASAEPLEVTSVRASGDRLRIRARDDDARWLAAGREILVPLSALLTCSSAAGHGGGGLRVEVGVHRDDVDLGSQRLSMPDAALLVDAAETLCSVRPSLRDYELSGPILRAASAGADEAECSARGRGV